MSFNDLGMMMLFPKKMKRRKKLLSQFQSFGAVYLNEYGEPVERTPQTDPYGFDGYVEWAGVIPKKDDKVSTDYSDRLQEWDWDKYDRLRKKHLAEKYGSFGQLHKETEAFLQEYHGYENLRLYRIMKYCNVATGYPVWRFDYTY